MRRPSGLSQRPLQLLQPYDDDTSETASMASWTEKGQPPSLPRVQFRGGSSPTVHLTPLHAPPAAYSGKGGVDAPAPTDAQGGSTTASFSALPPFSSRGQLKKATVKSSSTPAVYEQCEARDSVSSSAQPSRQLPSKPTSSVDRLATLYQQYQIPAEGKRELCPEGCSNEREREKQSPAPSPALPDTAARWTTTTRLHMGGSEKQDCDGGTSSGSACSSEAGEESMQTEDRQRGPSRTAHSHRLAASDTSPSFAHRATVGTMGESPMPAHRQSRQQQGRCTVTLPAALSGSGVAGVMNTAIFVWASMGFFEMRPNESEANSDVDSESGDSSAAREVQSVGSSAQQDPSDPHDVEAFLLSLEDFLGLFCDESSMVSSEKLAEYTALMRNGLWRVLFNAVFYCVTVLDTHRRRSSLSDKEREVCTGGPEDAYEVVFPSSSSVDDSEGGDKRSVEREAPVRFTWRVPGESEEERAARCARDPLPSDSHLWAGGPPYRARARKGEGEGSESHRLRGHDAGSERPAPPLDLYGGRLRAPLPVSDWYFTLRCLAQVGYRRDAFYLQTPFSASPFELLLALLWLTQQYRLLAVAEYVELSRRYGFLLQYHVEDSFWRGSMKGSAEAHTTASACRHAQTRERLLYHLNDASVWPPVSFDEKSAIHLRLAQLERCLGRSAPHESPTESATPQVRRLMAVQRLISLSLNRLYHALQRQAEQTVALGLHSPLDAQLCRTEYHDLYEEAMAGLKYVQGAECRLQAAAESLVNAGALVAFLLRYEESGVPAEEVLLALEEDDATWLSGVVDQNKAEGGDAKRSLWQQRKNAETPTSAAPDRWRRAVLRGTLPQPATSSLPTSAEALAQSLSTFRATQSRASLRETWRRLLRRSRVAPQTIQPENLRFVRDTEAQEIQEARVRENMRSRYSLQAALAAELAVLCYERQQRRQRSSSRSPLRSDAKFVEESANSRRMADADTDVEVPPIRVVLPSMGLVTNAAAMFAQLHAEEEAYGPVTLSTAELQLMEVGEPAAGSTTSARLELERLQIWEKALDAELGVQAQTEVRVAHCKKMLETLHHQFGFRMATPIVPGKTH
ncbi:hypothetical protein ABL78_7651 [Leptomonas seymouri]|uniref:Uncharacterized protein n=1 Tax=Leptomonas seymouri TaxID=5684 RepID=A0A0N1HZ90_LEPSE|nr:hypothetical protein ABL78_7651 [Leptomonas seymouri]|eukprot:KPI83321.1 hypothetical protein ABL78_7651 [Leptomonas seymouri]